MDARRIGVAISGGGYRAAAWGAGTLLYLADAGLSRHISTISSVSGGSITNAFFALGDVSRATAAQSWAESSKLAKRLSGNLAGFLVSLVANAVLWVVLVWAGAQSNGRIVFLGLGVGVILAFVSARISGDATFGHPITWVYLVVIAAMAAGLAATASHGLWWLLALLGLGGVVSWRGLVVGWALERTLFKRRGRSRLRDLSDTVEHVMCACDLHGRHHVYFGKDFVYSYGLGLGSRPGLPISAAVQSSANLPGAFGPRPMRSSPFGFQGSRYSSPLLALTDGGVYDNMAEEWLLDYRVRSGAFAKRVAGDPAGSAMARRLDQRTPDDIVVANASGPLGFRYAWTTFLPILGELLSLLRVKSILYDNGNTTRRRLLVDSFQSGARSGVLVHVATNPWSVVKAGRSSTDPEVCLRAEAVASLLSRTDGFGDPSAAPPTAGTVLYPLPKGRVSELARYSYVLTMTQAHIWRAWPLHDVPSAKTFMQWEAGAA